MLLERFGAVIADERLAEPIDGAVLVSKLRAGVGGLTTQVMVFSSGSPKRVSLYSFKAEDGKPSAEVSRIVGKAAISSGEITSFSKMDNYAAASFPGKKSDLPTELWAESSFVVPQMTAEAIRKELDKEAVAKSMEASWMDLSSFPGLIKSLNERQDAGFSD